MVSLPEAVIKKRPMTLVSVASLRHIRKLVLIVIASQVFIGFALLVVIGKLPW
jgi:hypothetical protein